MICNCDEAFWAKLCDDGVGNNGFLRPCFVKMAPERRKWRNFDISRNRRVWSDADSGNEFLRFIRVSSNFAFARCNTQRINVS